MLPSLFGLLFYGVLMGGFIVVAICGGLAGIAATFFTHDEAMRKSLARLLSVAVTTVLLFVLATLDWYIGSW